MPIKNLKRASCIVQSGDEDDEDQNLEDGGDSEDGGEVDDQIQPKKDVARAKHCMEHQGLVVLISEMMIYTSWLMDYLGNSWDPKPLGLHGKQSKHLQCCTEMHCSSDVHQNSN